MVVVYKNRTIGGLYREEGPDISSLREIMAKFQYVEFGVVAKASYTHGSKVHTANVDVRPCGK